MIYKDINLSPREESFRLHAEYYVQRLGNCFTDQIYVKINSLANDLLECWKEKRTVFICGNGGSGANAIHMANDFHYGIGACGPEPSIPGLRVDALSANQGVITCLGNDIGYENIYSHQLQVKGSPRDILIALSGSGKSPNILNAIKTAKRMEIKTYAVIAFTGGAALDLADEPIYFPVHDMQIAEDTQLMIGHICMQWLTNNKPKDLNPLL